MSDVARSFHFARCLRMIVVALCRGTAIVLLFQGAITLIHGSLWYLERRPLIASGMMPSSDAFEWLYLGIEEVLPGILLALCSAIIARWLVPAPKPVCLRCGYSTEKLTKPICPECGAPVAVDTTS